MKVEEDNEGTDINPEMVGTAAVEFKCKLADGFAEAFPFATPYPIPLLIDCVLAAFQSRTELFPRLETLEVRVRLVVVLSLVLLSDAALLARTDDEELLPEWVHMVKSARVRSKEIATRFIDNSNGTYINQRLVYKKAEHRDGQGVGKT